MIVKILQQSVYATVLFTHAAWNNSSGSDKLPEKMRSRLYFQFHSLSYSLKYICIDWPELVKIIMQLLRARVILLLILYYQVK